MQMKASLHKLQGFLICAFAFLIILKAYLAIILLIVLFAVVIIGNYKIIIPNLIKSNIHLIFVLYYIWHVLGMLWSTNTEYGFKDLETKLSFIVFPLIFSVVAVTPSLRRQGLLSYVSGCIIICVYLLYQSYLVYQINRDPQVFLYAGLSRFIHPTYLSIYLNTALLILFSLLKKNFERRTDFIIIPGIIFLVFVIMMLSSRMAIITNLISCIIFLILMKSNFKLKRWFFYVSLFLITIVAAFFITNKYYNRLEQVEHAVQHLEESRPESYSEYNSASSRPELWKEAIEVIMHHPIVGAGTGDIKDELFSEYKVHNFQYALVRNLNPHNQFLHTAVGLGLIGLILLLLCISSQLHFSFVNKDWLYFCFLIIISLNALTESNIEVQSGILLFNFFSMFFYSSIKTRLHQ